MSMPDRGREIKTRIQEIVRKAGAELLEFSVNHSGSKNNLRCVVDLPEGGITLDACAAINRKVAGLLEKNGDLGSDYTVEVNSPGLDRKLYTPKDFSRAKGRKVCLWLGQLVEEREYLEGRVLAVDGEKLSLGYKDKNLEINFDKIKVGKEKIEFK